MMPSTDRLKTKLVDKLRELFQLNQPDLDFGFYRIMRSKAEQVTNFIENDLLTEIRKSFDEVDIGKMQQLKEAVEREIKLAIEYESPDPENHPKVLEAKKRYEDAKDGSTAEAEIYDHLYRFFERYYDDGDFISRRYYTRETADKAAPFAIPYNGEEVMLHWANKDQYYIKSTEYFSNYRFNLSQGVDKLLQSQQDESTQASIFEDAKLPADLNVTFRIVDASEGEHDNVKSSDENKRFFIIHKAKPVELIDGELLINFEYRSDPKKTSQDRTWRDAKNTEAVETIFQALSAMPAAKHYLQGFETKAPTESNKDRTLLEKYIYQYTARNTRDYFIHKDLGSFLKRELDYYIKNEVMHLDDIVDNKAPKVEDYLDKIRVLRRIAGKLIEFLAQMEDFQKKLWLKKKFVVETNYCLTLDRVPEELYPEVIENREQIDEWIRLYAIDEIEGDAVTPAYSEPLSIEFLKANDKMMLDTGFFDDTFKAKLLDSIRDFDEQCDGLLIHSENFQALNLLQERYREQIKCVYIDPPYNTGDDGFVYRDSYQDSSWLSLLQQTISLTHPVMNVESTFFSSIDDREQAELRQLCDVIFGIENRLDRGIIIWNNAGSTKGFRRIVKNHEYILAYSTNAENVESLYGDNCKAEELDVIDERLQIKRSRSNPLAKVVFPAGLRIEDKSIEVVKTPINPGTNQIDIVEGEMHFKNGILTHNVTLEASFPYKNQMTQFFNNIGTDKKTYDTKKQEWIEVYFRANGVPYYRKLRNTKILSSVLKDLPSGGSSELNNVIPHASFSHPKPVDLVNELLIYFTTSKDIVLDYFAGSGTTGHAVINLNREDGGERKYILVEMGDYFDTVLKPRICKVVYSDVWKDGKPQSRDAGVSHCLKYLRLESYEDTLNNLELQSDSTRDRVLEASDSLKEDYLLHYMLDVESRGSLLDIDAFADPTAYTLKVKKPGSDAYENRTVDLIETFNYLIGLRLSHLAEPQRLKAKFAHLSDPDLPEDQDPKLVIDGDLVAAEDGKWWIRKIEGWMPKNPYAPNEGGVERVLIVWRNLTGNLEEDNLVLNAWFEKNCTDTSYDTVYVNGSNSLAVLRGKADRWQVRLIEEEFMKRMWSSAGV